MQRKLHLWALALLCVFSVTFVSSCDDDDDPSDNGVIEYFRNSTDLTTHRDALDEADLIANIRLFNASTTFFAPTNGAYQAFLDINNFDDLEDVPALALEGTLRGHILDDDEKRGADFANPGYYKTINDRGDFATDVFVTTTNGTVRVNGQANVIRADQDTEDGTVHTIDAVLGLPTLLTFANADPRFSTLVAAIDRADADGSISALLAGATPTSPITIFAPTNAAFQAFLDEDEDDDFDDLDDISDEMLAGILRNHVLSTEVRAESITNSTTANPVGGGTLSFNVSGANPRITAANSTANIIILNVTAINGTIHAIDQLLLP